MRQFAASCSANLQRGGLKHVVIAVADRRRTMTRRSSRRALRRVDAVLREPSDERAEPRERLGRMTRFHVLHDGLMNRKFRSWLGKDQKRRAKLVAAQSLAVIDAARFSEVERFWRQARETVSTARAISVTPMFASVMNLALLVGDVLIVTGALAPRDGGLPYYAIPLAASAFGFTLWFAGKLAGVILGGWLRVDHDDVATHNQPRSVRIVEVVTFIGLLAFIGASAFALGQLRTKMKGTWAFLSAMPAIGSMTLAVLIKSQAHYGLAKAESDYRSARRRLRVTLIRLSYRLARARRARALLGAVAVAKITMLERAVAAQAGQLDPSPLMTEGVPHIDQVFESLGVLRSTLSPRLEPRDELAADFEDTEEALDDLWSKLRGKP
jgi:hypothetical protein